MAHSVSTEHMIERIDGAIFDVDGTLLDSVPIWMRAGELYLRSKHIEPEPDLAKILFTMSLEASSRYMKERYGLAESEPQILRDINALMDHYYATVIPVKPGVVSFLDCLKANHIPMAVATVTDRGCIETAFDRLGLAHYFSEIFTCSDLATDKHRPDIFLAAARHLGMAPDDTWVFEDSLHAAETAKKAGFRLIGVLDETSASDHVSLRQLADAVTADYERWDIRKD